MSYFYYVLGLAMVSLRVTVGFVSRLCIVCVRAFTKSLDKIFIVVRYFTKGNLSHRIYIKTPYEFQKLAIKLKQMVHNIQTASSRLEVSNQEWEDTFDAITDAVSVQDVNFNIIKVNKAYTKIALLGENVLCGRKCYEIVHCTNKPIENCPAVKAIETKTPQTVVIEEKRLHAYLQISAYPMINQAGDCIGVTHIIRDVTEKKKLEKELEDYRTHLEQKVEERTTEINELLTSVGFAMATTIDKKSPWTANHSRRVYMYALGIARELQMDDDFVEKLRMSCLLHDIGKIGVPDDLLNSTERLSEAQLSIIRDHTIFGAEIIKNVKHFEHVILAVLHHHEFYNGTGTPSGLYGERIPFVARIIAVADAYDAMTSERPYRKSLSHEEAVAELKRCAGTQLDPKVVDAFLVSVSSFTKQHILQTQNS